MEVEKVDFKKLFPDKKISQKKVLDFLDKKGFYIVLALCITAIAATAAVITAHNIRSSRSIGEEDIISPDMASSIMDENGNSSSYLLPQDGFENEDAAETLGKASEAVKPTEPAASPKVQESPKPSDKPQKTETSTKRKTRTRKLKTQNHREKLKANPQTNPKARLRVARKLHL